MKKIKFFNKILYIAVFLLVLNNNLYSYTAPQKEIYKFNLKDSDIQMLKKNNNKIIPPLIDTLKRIEILNKELSDDEIDTQIKNIQKSIGILSYYLNQKGQIYLLENGNIHIEDHTDTNLIQNNNLIENLEIYKNWLIEFKSIKEVSIPFLEINNSKIVEFKLSYPAQIPIKFVFNLEKNKIKTFESYCIIK